MARVKYNYALDEHGRIVSIKQASLERTEKHTYKCIGCGNEMIARLGEFRNWHFAHRCDDPNCGAETYLHKLAKRLIREKFVNDSSFPVSCFWDVSCSITKSCPFAKKEMCHIQELHTIDLKEYYDHCDEEKTVGDYIADLLLTNTAKPEQKPVLIEVQVSHKSTPKKRDSGHRIIELRIKTEDDLQKLLSSPIVEHPDAQFQQVSDAETIGYAKFYGFKKTSISNEPLSKRSIQRFYLFRSGKAYVSNMDEFKPCRNAGIKDNEKAIFEASIDSFYLDSPSPYEFGYMAARLNGFKTNNCTFCKYHRNGYDNPLSNSPIFCCLYKKFGTPKYPEPQFAQQCGYYQDDIGQMEVIQKSMPPIVIAT